MKSPPLPRLSAVALLSVAVIVSIPALVWGSIWMAVPWALLALGISFLMPRTGILLFVFSWFFRYPIPGVPGAFAPDFLLIPIVAGFLFQRVATGERLVDATPFNRLAVIWLLLFALSLINAVDYGAGVKNWLRHLMLFALFPALVGLLDRSLIRRSVVAFCAFCALLCVPNLVTFALSRGDIRAFGIASIVFSGMLALAGTFAIAQYLFTPHPRRSSLWGVLFLIITAGQAANQSRGAMLQLLTGVMFVSIVGLSATRRLHLRRVRGRLIGIAVGGVFAAIVLLATAGPAIRHALHRYSRASSGDVHTLNVRGHYWSAALQLFTAHPIIGVGPAQTLSLVRYLPNSHFDLTLVATQGLGVHNSILRYLAECGLLGSLVLWALLWRAFSLGRGALTAARKPEELAWLVGLWGIVFVIVLRFLYEGHVFYSTSGIMTISFTAMLYRMRYPHDPATRSSKAVTRATP